MLGGSAGWADCLELSVMAATVSSATHVLALLDGHPGNTGHRLHAQLLHSLAAFFLRAALLAAASTALIIYNKQRARQVILWLPAGYLETLLMIDCNQSIQHLFAALRYR